MDVVVVRGVVAGRQHGREIVAGSEMHVVQKALLFGRAVPTFLHRNPASVGERERRDVDRISESVFGNSRAAGADHSAARISRDLFDFDDWRTEPSHRCRLHAFAHPVVERRHNRTGERRRRRQCCRTGRAIICGSAREVQSGAKRAVAHA